MVDVPLAGYVTLRPDGRLVIPPDLMDRHVKQTLGAKLWYNEQDAALGVRLLRGANRPPYRIERLSDSDGAVTGELNVGDFLRKVGRPPGDEPRELRAYYYDKHHLMEIRLTDAPPDFPEEVRNVLEDFPALED